MSTDPGKREQPAGSTQAPWVFIAGEGALVEQIGHPVRVALAARGVVYHVRIEGVGRCGDVMVSITGEKGRLPLLFSRGELEPGYVVRVVTDTVAKFGF